MFVKKAKAIVCAVLAVMMVVSGMVRVPERREALAETVAPQIAVNSFKVEFPDAQPFIDGNGRTLIPVRFVAEKLGAAVDWDASASTVLISKDGTNIKMPIGSKDFTVTKNGNTRTVTMDTEAMIRDGRTYVPIRYVAEELGAFVDWASYYRIVDIVLPDPDSGLTAADIQRLRSYPVRQVFTDGQIKEYETPVLWDNYTFANAHYAAVTAPATKVEYRDYVNIVNKITDPDKHYASFAAGSSSYDYALFIMAMAKAEYENATREATTAGIQQRYGISYKFYSDPSLVYKQKGPDYACYTVRGVVEVAFSPDPQFNQYHEWIENTWSKYCGIENVEYGKHYCFDVEEVFSPGFDNAINLISEIRFDPDGSVGQVLYPT